MESPSHHPWLQNMERILRIMKKSFGKAAGFAKAIDFLRFCAAKHYNPWIGRIKEFLALSRSKLIHIEKHCPKLNKVHAQIVRLVRLSKDITISQIKHFIKNSVYDPVQARIDKDDLQYLIDENLIVKKTIYKGPWEQTVYAAAHQSQC